MVMQTDIDPVSNAFWIANNMEVKRYEYPLTKEDYVIDLGAHNGEFATTIHARYGCKVLCVEPTGAANWMAGMPWVRVIQAAAGTKSGRIKFGGNSYYTSAFEPGTQEFPCFNVLELFDQSISLMKINIEGMEYDIMRHILKNNAQKNVDYFQIQFHQIPFYEQTYKFIHDQLTESHELMWRVPYVWESWKRK
jgi:FkbM family methyltransferase